MLDVERWKLFQKNNQVYLPPPFCPHKYGNLKRKKSASIFYTKTKIYNCAFSFFFKKSFKSSTFYISVRWTQQQNFQKDNKSQNLQTLPSPTA